MCQNMADHPRIFDERDETESPAAPSTGQHIESETPGHQLRPQHIRSPMWGASRRIRLGVCGRRSDITGPLARRRWLDAGAPGGVGAQDAVVQDQVDSRPRGQCREALQELDRIEQDMRRAVRPAMPELEKHLPSVRQVNPIVRHGWSQRIPARPFEPGPIVGGHDHRRMEIEPVPMRVTRAGADGDSAASSTDTRHIDAPRRSRWVSAHFNLPLIATNVPFSMPASPHRVTKTSVCVTAPFTPRPAKLLRNSWPFPTPDSGVFVTAASGARPTVIRRAWLPPRAARGGRPRRTAPA